MLASQSAAANSFPSFLRAANARRPALLALLALTTSSLAAQESFNTFRGPSGRGTIAAAPAASGLEPVWTRPIGSAYAGLSIANGLVVTSEAHEGRDTVVGLDVRSGETRWRVDLADAYIGHGGSRDGVIATPAIADGQVYAVGPRGQVLAITLDEGRELWRTQIDRPEEDQLATDPPYYGFASSPAVVGDLVIVQVGNPGGAAVALERSSGRVAWRTDGDLIEAQSPIVAHFEGGPQILVASNTSLVGLDPSEGTTLWRYDVDAQSAFALTTSPIALPDGSIFHTPHDDRSVVLRPPTNSPAGEEPPKAELVWSENALTRTYSPAALIGDALVGYTSRFLAAYSVTDGSRLWRSRSPGDGFLIGLGSRQAAVITKDGTLHLGNTQGGWQELASAKPFDDLVWTPPSYADGALFVRSMTEIARFDLVADEVTETGSGAQLPAALRNLEKTAAGVDAFLDGQTTPLIEGDRATFLWRGEADDVGIAGDFLGMRREESFQRVEGTDLWWYSAQIDPRLDVSYILYVDYEATLDPRNPRREVNTVMGWNANWVRPGGEVEMSAFSMPEAPSPPAHLRENAPPADLPGRVSELKISAEPALLRQMGEAAGMPEEGIGRSIEAFERTFEKPVPVWLPPGYDEGNQRYPVVYLLKGPGALDPQRGRWLDTLNRRVGHDFAPLIVVFLDGPLPQQMPFDPVITSIDRQLRTLDSRDARAVISMGMVSMEAMFRAGTAAERIGKFGIQSFFGFEEEVEGVLAAVRPTDDRSWTGWLEWGSMGIHSPTEGWDMRAFGRQVYESLERDGATMYGGEVIATLEWKSWRNRTHEMLRALFPTTP